MLSFSLVSSFKPLALVIQHKSCFYLWVLIINKRRNKNYLLVLRLILMIVPWTLYGCHIGFLLTSMKKCGEKGMQYQFGDKA